MIYSGKPNIARMAGWLLLLLLAIMYLAWPGDHHWGDLDQSLYVNLALQANQEGRLSTCWRQGNAGIRYHPFPIWVYQCFLALTHDLVLISFVKALLTLIACLGGLYYLSRVLSYPRWVLLLFCFFPHCYLYGSEFTDDSWLVPVSLLAVACYARFSEKLSTAALAVTIFLMTLLFYLHPRGALLFFPVIFTMALFDRQRLKNKPAFVLLIVAAMLLIIFPYLTPVKDTVPGDVAGLAVPFSGRAARFLSAALTGGLFFSYDFFQLLIPHHFTGKVLTPVMKVIIGLTMLSYLLMISGIGITVVSLIRKRRSKIPPDLEDRLGGLSLFSVVVFSMVMAFFDLFHAVEYYSAVWFCFFFFIWRAIKIFQERRYLKILPILYGLSMAFCWICFWLMVHLEGVGLTLDNAMAAARQISQYSPESRVVQKVSLENGNMVDIMNANLESAFGNVWYYRESVNLLNKNEILQKCLKGSYIYLALVPMLNIYYAGQDLKRLPVRTVRLSYRDAGGKNHLTVTVEPEDAAP
ncbi:MAG: glycosyltransferase family 39 protein [Thermodesulfobacteriota bacterium]